MTQSIAIALPIADRQRSHTFYRETLGLEPFGDLAEDGVPEPLRFRLDERTALMLIPSGGFGWVIGGQEIAPPTVSEVLLSLTLTSAEEVTTLVTRMHDGGGQVLTAPRQQEWGFAAVVTDPDGHAWQIITDVEHS